MAISYWRRKDRYYRLIGSKCRSCGSEYFPPVYKCRRCGSREVEDKAMSQTGKIVTYTIMHESMSGFEDQEPLAVGIIQLDNGVKVLGQIVDTPPEQINVGDKVKAVFRKVRVEGEKGQIFYGYKFVKI